MFLSGWLNAAANFQSWILLRGDTSGQSRWLSARVANTVFVAILVAGLAGGAAMTVIAARTRNLAINEFEVLQKLILDAGDSPSTAVVADVAVRLAAFQDALDRHLVTVSHCWAASIAQVS